MEYNPVEFTQWGQDAARFSLNGGEDLDREIAKIADARELNPHQTQRVIEEANKFANKSVRAIADDPSFVIKLASLEGVTAKISTPCSVNELPKLAAVDISKDLNPFSFSRDKDLEKLSSMQESFPENPDQWKRNKTDWMEACVTVSKMGHRYEEELTSELLVTGLEVQEEVEKLAKYIYREVKLGGVPYGDFCKYAMIHCPDSPEVVTALMGVVTEELVKMAGPVDADMIDTSISIPGNNLDIINGEHTLAIELDTIVDKLRQFSSKELAARELSDELTSVDKAIKVLRTQEDIKEYLTPEFEAVADAAKEGKDTFLEGIGIIKKAGLGLAALVAAVLGLGGLATGAGVGAMKKETLGGKFPTAVGMMAQQRGPDPITGE